MGRSFLCNKNDFKIGDELFEELPPVDFGRIAAQSARQVIIQSVRAAEKERGERSKF